MQTIEFQNDGRGYHASAHLAASAAAVDSDGDVAVTDSIGVFLSPTLSRLTTQIVAASGATVDVYYSCASHKAIEAALAALKTATEQTVETTLRAVGAKVNFTAWASGTVPAGTTLVDFFEAPVTAVMVIARGTGGAFAHCVAGM